MPKYLNTKPGSLESAVLEAVSPAQQAAIAISKKEKEKKEELVDEDKAAYEKFFKSALKKFGVDSPADFKSDEEKKKFFDYIDKNYKSDDEKSEAVKEEVELDEDTVILDLEDDDKKLMSNIKRMGIKVKKVSNEPGDGYAEYSLTGSKSNLEKANKKLKLVDDDIMAFKESALIEGFSPKQIKMAIGVASDKRYAGGNMSGAVAAIDKIKKGLSDHPQVAAVLKRQNESLAEKAARHISDMWKESASAKDKKEDKKVKEEDEGSETTMTGKPANKIAINPKSKEEK